MVTILDGLVGGFNATLIMTGLMMMMKDDLPLPTAVLWAKYVDSGESNQYLIQGMVLHFLYGTIAGGVFTWLVDAFGLSVATLGGGLLWGIVWGIILFVIGAGFWLMMVLDIPLDRELVIRFGSPHFVYGIVLGLWIVYITL